MRDVTAAQTTLNTQYGTEPIIIVEIQWSDGLNRIAYADRKIVVGGVTVVNGQIVDIGSIDSAAKVDGTSDSSQVQLTLEDTGGTIKTLCDSLNLHKRPVWVYQWFQGLALADKFLLFQGEINSPFIWNEGDRTVTFDVTTKIEDVEAGFSMEEGDFPLVPPDALGKAWPLAFGSVCDIQAVQVRAPRSGTLVSGEGIHDYTLESRICQSRYIQCANVPLGEAEYIDPSTQFNYDDEGLVVIVAKKLDTWGPDQSCVESRFFSICDLMYQLEQQEAYEHPTMTINDGNRLFPQNETITLNIEGGLFTGHFVGDVFHIDYRKHPDYDLNPPTKCGPIADRYFAVTGVLDQSDWVRTESGSAWYDASVYNGSSGGVDIDPREVHDFCNTTTQTGTGRASEGGPADSQKALDDMITSSFFWARAGSKVYMEDEAEVLYIVNLLPCTITRVAAMKTVNGISKLISVPSSFYTIYETDYDGYTVTEIGMTKPLSERSEVITELDGTKRTVSSNWSDELYVSVTSSIGPNPVNIIAWLLGKYTSLSVDTASFLHVYNRLLNYPSNFVLMERKNVMQLVEDIAYQSRCVVYVRDGIAFIKYLSEEPTSAATISASDVLANTLKITLSSTDDVATKHVISWSRSQSEGDLNLILKHNVAKYGTHDKSTSYYTQNIYDNVLKSATFWMIRDANVWKQVEFSTPIKHLALEVFDCVTLDLPDVAPAPVKAIITSMAYDVGAQEIAFICWTPIKAGQNTPYTFAWPADIPAGTSFPPDEERLAGLGYNFVVAPPDGHLLYVAPEDNGLPKLTLTSGDPSPSDLDDTLATCFCPTADDAVVEEVDPVFNALKKAQKANQDAQQNLIDTPLVVDSIVAAGSGGGSGGSSKDKDKKPTGSCDCVIDPSQPDHDCKCIVKVMYSTPDLVGPGCHGPCNCKDKGMNCASDLFTYCYTMGDNASAISMKSHLDYDSWARGCSWTCGGTAPLMTSVTCCGTCASMPTDPPGPKGQVKEPKQQ
jgi:hypothetical protein